MSPGTLVQIITGSDAGRVGEVVDSEVYASGCYAYVFRVVRFDDGDRATFPSSAMVRAADPLLVDEVSVDFQLAGKAPGSLIYLPLDQLKSEEFGDGLGAPFSEEHTDPRMNTILSTTPIPEPRAAAPAICDRIGEFLDGEMSEPGAEAMRAHLASCRRCQSELHALTSMAATTWPRVVRLDRDATEDDLRALRLRRGDVLELNGHEIVVDDVSLLDGVTVRSSF